MCIRDSERIILVNEDYRSGHRIDTIVRTLQDQRRLVNKSDQHPHTNESEVCLLYTSLSKCKEWAAAFSVALAAEEIERPDGPNTLLKSGAITFDNGSRILAVPGRPDTVRGFSANLVLTEFAF